MHEAHTVSGGCCLLASTTSIFCGMISCSISAKVQACRNIKIITIHKRKVIRPQTNSNTPTFEMGHKGQRQFCCETYLRQWRIRDSKVG